MITNAPSRDQVPSSTSGQNTGIIFNNSTSSAEDRIAQTVPSTGMNDLPNELLDEIALYQDRADTLSLALTNRRLNKVASSVLFRLLFGKSSLSALRWGLHFEEGWHLEYASIRYLRLAFHEKSPPSSLHLTFGERNNDVARQMTELLRYLEVLQPSRLISITMSFPEREPRKDFDLPISLFTLYVNIHDQLRRIGCAYLNIRNTSVLESDGTSEDDQNRLLASVFPVGYYYSSNSLSSPLMQDWAVSTLPLSKTIVLAEDAETLETLLPRLDLPLLATITFREATCSRDIMFAFLDRQQAISFLDLDFRCLPDDSVCPPMTLSSLRSLTLQESWIPSLLPHLEIESFPKLRTFSVHSRGGALDLEQEVPMYQEMLRRIGAHGGVNEVHFPLAYLNRTSAWLDVPRPMETSATSVTTLRVYDPGQCYTPVEIQRFATSIALFPALRVVRISGSFMEGAAVQAKLVDAIAQKCRTVEVIDCGLFDEAYRVVQDEAGTRSVKQTRGKSL